VRNIQNDQDKNQAKRIVRKAGEPKASTNQAPISETQQMDNERHIPLPQDQATCSVGKVILTEEEVRARISRKAYELYEQRRKRTHVDDWVEAERFVKAELLAEGQWAGSV
jgi:hypothetical protein